MKKLDHKNIVKMYEMYIDKTNGIIYTVMEYIKEKEMFEIIRSLGHYSGFYLCHKYKNLLKLKY